GTNRCRGVGQACTEAPHDSTPGALHCVPVGRRACAIIRHACACVGGGRACQPYQYLADVGPAGPYQTLERLRAQVQGVVDVRGDFYIGGTQAYIAPVTSVMMTALGKLVEELTQGDRNSSYQSRGSLAFGAGGCTQAQRGCAH